jgi:hypothetical protein
MRKGFLLVAAILFTSHASFAQETSGVPSTPAAGNPAMKLADATAILLRTKEPLSSATATVGDRVPFRVTEDVKAGDLIVIQRGAEAWGVVTAVQPRRRKGRGGNVDVGIESVQLLTGESAPLRAAEHAKGGGGSMGRDMAELSVRTMGLGLPLVPLFLLERGEDARLPTGTKVTAFLNGDVPLDRTAFEKVQPVIGQLSGPATVTIFRTKWPAATAYRPSVYCGKIAVARLSYGAYLKIQLPPGKYSFRSSDDQAIELHLEEGQKAYVQMQMVFHGLSTKGHLKQVSNSEGEDEVASLHELSGKDVATISSAQLADLLAVPEKN